LSADVDAVRKQTKHLGQARHWLMLANNGTNTTAGRLIDLHGLCRTCRRRVSTKGRRRRVARVAELILIGKLFATIDIVLCCITIATSGVQACQPQAARIGCGISGILRVLLGDVPRSGLAPECDHSYQRYKGGDGCEGGGTPTTAKQVMHGTPYWNRCEYFTVQVLHNIPSTIGDKVKLVSKV